MADNQNRQDLEQILDYLVLAARTDHALHQALERQARRLLINLGSHEVPMSNTISVPQSPPPSTPDRLEALMERFRNSPSELPEDFLAPASGEIQNVDEEVSRLITACQLKAWATGWRIRSLVDGNATVSERNDLINRGADHNIYLWMVTRNKEGELSRDPLNFERLEATYRVCARTLEAWQRLPLSRAGEVLPLIAEAQGMIRVAAAQVGLQRPEDTAQAVYEWLRGQAAELRIYIHRHMRPNDPANPDLVQVLDERVSRLMETGTFNGYTEDSDDHGADESMHAEYASMTSPEVAEVAELLQGRTVAVFGGECRAERVEALEEAFGLHQLVWVECGSRYSPADHEHIFDRPDLALVLVAIRRTESGQGMDLPEMAAERGIPLVRLAGGYGVSRVAHAILDQVGDDIRAHQES